MKGPHIIIGSDALPQQLPALIEKRGLHRLLLAAGPHFLQSAAGMAFVDKLGRRIAVVKETPAGLLQAATLQAEASALPQDLDGYIAVGGGRSIDYAKALRYYTLRAPDFFAAVPTTAGSGSDATSFAVVYAGVDKLSLEAPGLLPNVVLWQESLLDDLPQKQRAISGLDALTQCLESLWSLRATPVSRAIAWEAGNWLWRHLPDFVASPTPDTTISALYAAHYSGRAINTSRTTGPHALSYYLTANHGIDHGHAVALLLPVFIRYNAAAPESIAAVLELLQCADADEAVRRWQAMMTEMGLAMHLSDLELTDSILLPWLQQVNAERFANNPLPFEPLRLAQLLQQTLFA